MLNNIFMLPHYLTYEEILKWWMTICVNIMWKNDNTLESPIYIYIYILDAQQDPLTHHKYTIIKYNK